MNNEDMEIVRVKCNAVKEGFLWAVRNGRFNRMREHNGRKAWGAKEDAIKAIKRGLEIDTGENLVELVEV